MINPVREILVNSRLGQKAYLYSSGTQTKFKYALSLLPQLHSVLPKEVAIFAWTQCDTPEGMSESCLEQDSFVQLMQQTIKQSPAELCYLLGSRAKRQGEGWLSIVDERAPLIYGRAPEPDDIIGFCRVEDGQVLPETYDPMPSYRLISRLGIFSLPKPLHEKLLNQLV